MVLATLSPPLRHEIVCLNYLSSAKSAAVDQGINARRTRLRSVQCRRHQQFS